MTTLDLHLKSVRLGSKFADLYRNSNDHQEIDDALEAYKASRRLITEYENGKRYGALEAWESTDGLHNSYRPEGWFDDGSWCHEHGFA